MAESLDERIENAFGSVTDPMPAVAERAEQLLDSDRAIVWEGDASTFEFAFVSESAADVLGYPAERWLEPGFWADVVVHPEDRDYAVSYCALATGQGRDHEFEYRAVAADGRVVRLRDVVKVVLNERGRPERLRGIMIPLDG